MPTDDPEPGWLASLPVPARSAILGAGAAGMSAAIIVPIVFLGWMTAAYSTGSGGQATATGFALWLLSHGVPVDAGFGPLSLVPWLLAVVPLACCVWGGHTVVSSMPPQQVPRLPNLGGLRQDLVLAALTFALGYAAACVVGALLARASLLTPAWPATLLFPPVLALIGFAEAVRYDAAGQLASVAPGAAGVWRARAPAWAAHAWRAGLRAAGALLAVGVLLSLSLVVLRWDQVTGVFHTLHTGLVGGVLLVLASAAYAGTAAAWATSWFAGPGFSVGAETSVSIASAQSGSLPPFPLLGVLPETGPMPWATWLLILLPVGAGMLAAHLALRGVAADVYSDTDRDAHRDMDPGADIEVSWRARASVAGAAAGVAAVVLLVVAWLSSGSLGSGQLAAVGVPLGWFALAITGELAAGALLVATLRAELLAGWWQLLVSRATRAPRSPRED